MRTRTLASSLAIGSVLFLALTACAPEPVGPAEGAEGQGESSWQGAEDVPEELETNLVESFPVDEFPIPDGAEVYDNGERNQDEWFLVLNAEDEDAAETLWEDIITAGEFSVEDFEEDPEIGTSASLNNGALGVGAVTAPQENCSVLLSYEITRSY
ncbi:MAG: hypothetical protein ACTHZ9_05775 [Leucobacter sp.]